MAHVKAVNNIAVYRKAKVDASEVVFEDVNNDEEIKENRHGNTFDRQTARPLF